MNEQEYEIWYEVKDWPTISEVKVTKHTDKSVWVFIEYTPLFNENIRFRIYRRDRSSQYSSFFPTIEEAIKYLDNVRKDKVDAIASANKKLADHDKYVKHYLESKGMS